MPSVFKQFCHDIEAWCSLPFNSQFAGPKSITAMALVTQSTMVTPLLSIDHEHASTGTVYTITTLSDQDLL